MKKVIFVVAWCALGLFNFGTMNSQTAWEATHLYPRLHYTQRDKMGFLVGESCLIPPIELFSSAIISNFWQHGWDLTDRPWHQDQ